MPEVQNSSSLADAIESISVGGLSPVCKDINFYDYDGTLLDSYTLQEAESLSALPILPEHSGLTAQGWNYTLAQVQSAARNGYQVTVGAVYTTTDGSTKLYLYVEKGTRIPKLMITVKMAANSQATIDWGDGTSGTLNNPSSSDDVVYAEKTDYTEVTEDVTLCVRIIGGSFLLGKAYGVNVFGVPIFDDNQLEDSPILVKAEVGSNCTGLEESAFQRCNLMSSVSIPRSVSKIKSSAFRNCYRLRGLIIPETITYLSSRVFSDNYSLEAVSVPESVTRIEDYGAQNCYSLKRYSFPQTVTHIGHKVFMYDHAITSFVVPHNVTSMGVGVFRDCANLVDVSLPQSITEITSEAFYDCKSLRSVKILSSVTSIGTYAFYNCYRLYVVDLTSFTDPTHIPALADTNAFTYTPSYLKLKVANQQMLEAFSAATNWATYASQFTTA